MYTPCAAISFLCFARNLGIYNLRFDQSNKDGHLYILDDINRKRGSFGIISDSCSGHNRNRFTIAALHEALHSSNLIFVSLTYVVSRDASVEKDIMHIAFEISKMHGRRMNVPNDWFNIIQGAR